jgi:putative ABC transport system permease protein
MAISVRERTSELAVLKAIGFSGRAVLFFILAESLFIAQVGGLLGLGLALLAVPALANALNGMLPHLVLEPSILVMGLFAALAVGIASGILPGLGAMRMRVVNAMRKV